MNKLFSVLEQCYCMEDAPQDHYPDANGICQYCVIKKLITDTMRENERLRDALKEIAQTSEDVHADFIARQTLGLKPYKDSDNA